MKLYLHTIDLDNFFECKIMNIFLPISLTYVLGAQKNRFIEMGLLSTHNIFFWLRNKKINILTIGLLTKGLLHTPE